MSFSSKLWLFQTIAIGKHIILMINWSLMSFHVCEALCLGKSEAITLQLERERKHICKFYKPYRTNHSNI